MSTMAVQTNSQSDAIRQISDELKEKFDAAGMHRVAAFMETLEEIMTMIQEDPTKVLAEMKEQFDAFKEQIQAFMEDPAALMPAGGIAGCGAWYGGNVKGKLRGLSDDAEEMLGNIKELITQIVDPMKTLGEVLNEVMSQMQTTVKKLAQLPSELDGLAGSVRGHADVANIDTIPMKRCLDTSGISSPLDTLAGLNGPLKDAIEAVKVGVDNLIGYLENCPTRVKGCFDVPTPLCFLQGTLVSQAPTAMTHLLEMLDSMKKSDLARVQSLLGKVGGEICNLDPVTVSEPVQKFAESATGHVDDLDKLVSGAKLEKGVRSSGRGALCKMMGGA